MIEHMDTLVKASAIGWAMYAGHHAGDYWVQTDHQAKTKGLPGAAASAACLAHVTSYLATQFVSLWILWLFTGIHISLIGMLAGLALSGVTHYLADRREHGIMFRLARALPGKVNFLELGKPREGAGPEGLVRDDNPSLGTGAWALDQAWHIYLGVFLASLVMAVLS
jgi:hypothetical protein